jgi:corrinoid protein of di/trimethylamine methyltransferase
MDMEKKLTSLQKAIIEHDEEASKRLTKQALDKGAKPSEIIERELSPALDIVGEKFEKQEYFLPHLVLCGDAAKAVVDVLKAHAPGVKATTATIVIGTVQGDIHDIGKNLVSSFLSSSGFEVYDLGIDVPPLTFIEKAEEVKADIIGVSALMNQSMPVQEEIITLLKDMGLRERFKVMIGGSPTTAEYAEMIGADAWGNNPSEAVEQAKRLVAVK